jgi:hypothetical protein
VSRFARFAAFALVVCTGGWLAGCAERPDVRVLADERLRMPVEEAANLFEMRTGRRVRTTFASAGRVGVLLHTASHHLILAEAAQLAAHPVTSEFEARTKFAIGQTEQGVGYACMLSRRSAGSEEPRRLWQFLQESETRAIFDAAGVRLPPGSS